MKKIAMLIVGAAALASSPTPVWAQDTASETAADNASASTESALEVRANQLIAFINGETEPSAQELFTSEFLAVVPLGGMRALPDQYGKALSVEKLDRRGGTQANFEIRMEKALAKGVIALAPDENNKIGGLRILSFDRADDSPEKIVADLDALPGSVTAYFATLSGGEPIIAHGEDVQMPIGSTVKLYVLAALAEEIKQGRRSWDDVIPLSVKSLPSGMLQDWPDKAPLTLASLASLMISISDNTATDQLIAELGRERVLKAMVDSGHAKASLNDPIITTRNLFQLKGGDRDRLALFTNGDAALRSQILELLNGEPLSSDSVDAAFSQGPVALDVEWFASGKDLANLFRFMKKTGDPKSFEMMAIDPNLPPVAQENWAYSGYKGGSEPGVLNLTWLLTDESGEDFILWLSWRDDEANVDRTLLENIAQRIFGLQR